MQTKLHFSRFEFKYLLRENFRRDLEKELQYFIELDPYVASQPGNKYFVRSLYYDDGAKSCYYEKIDGMMDRAKFRIRTYTDARDSDTSRFLEVKGRHNALVFKHRIQLVDQPERSPAARAASSSWSEVPTPYFDDTTHEVLSRLAEGPLRSRFLRELHRKELKPVVLIDYRRRPYVSKYDPEFRLTFDDSLRCSATSRLFPRSHETYQRVLPGYTILEVKFRYHVPKWFHRLIQSFELRRVSISKYCAGVEACRLAPKLE